MNLIVIRFLSWLPSMKMFSFFIPVVKRDHNMFGKTPSIAPMSILHIDPAIHLLSVRHGIVPHLVGACISPVIV